MILPTFPHLEPLTLRERLRHMRRVVPLRTRDRLRRWRLAWRFATGAWSESDAHLIFGMAERRAACGALVSLGYDDVLHDLEAIYEPHPRAEEYARQAALFVIHQWDGSGFEHDSARSEAIELAERWAREDGAPFTIAREDADNDHQETAQ